jgi:hypothetical protein
MNTSIRVSHSDAEVLFLSSNNFTGKIDPILGGKLSENLRGLYLSDNGFNGILPTELCDLTDLSKSLLKNVSHTPASQGLTVFAFPHRGTILGHQ